MGHSALTKRYFAFFFSTFVPSSPTDSYLAKRRTANHPCPVCGKHYVNEGSLRKHLACHPETSQLTTSLRMWPCSVCQAVFTHESGRAVHFLTPNSFSFVRFGCLSTRRRVTDLVRSVCLIPFVCLLLCVCVLFSANANARAHTKVC